jgi:hypothetical protein
MGSGGYVIAEWDGVQKAFPAFQTTMKALDDAIIQKCSGDWAPRTFGGLAPGANQYGRTTVLPALFDNAAGVQLVHWRQRFLAAGHQTLLAGCRAGNTIPEDFKVAWVGLAFPNKQQQITEIRFQIGDRKFGRINLEGMKAYNVPALIFEEGYIIDEETAFDLYGYVETPDYQRMVMLGACYFKQMDRALGNPGAVI